MENVAVFPVPDWACAITSLPLTTGTIARCWIAEGFSKPTQQNKMAQFYRLECNQAQELTLKPRKQLKVTGIGARSANFIKRESSCTYHRRRFLAISLRGDPWNQKWG